MVRAVAGRMGLLLLVATACIAMSARMAAGQAPAPSPDCNSVLLELFPCLNFLSNSSVSTVDPVCCSALSNVSTSSPFCLCQLISPAFANQSAQLGINDTRAQQLPGLCSLGISPSSCNAILGPSAAPAPVAPVPVSAAAPISVVPSPAISVVPSPAISVVPSPAISVVPSPASSVVPSPAFSIPAFTPVPAPVAGGPISSPESSVSPGPAVNCDSEIATLAGCLTFLSGSDTRPSSACCTNLGSIVSTTPQCLCALASSPAIASVNATLVLELPSLCGVSASISDCSAAGAPSGVPIGTAGPGGSPGSSGAKSASSPSLYMVIALGFAAFAHALVQ